MPARVAAVFLPVAWLQAGNILPELELRRQLHELREGSSVCLVAARGHLPVHRHEN